MKIKIQNESYNLKTKWSEMSLLDARAVLQIEVPEALKECYEELKKKKPKYKEKYEALETKDLIKTIPKFYGDVICALSDIPNEVMDLVGYEDRIKWFTEFYERIYLDLYFKTPTHDPKYIDKFTHKGEEFYFPEVLKIFGQHIPMYNEEAISFAEESDIIIAISNMGQLGFGAMSEVAALMCRKKGEQYSEERTVERAALFSDLPMDIVWEVFFYTVKQCNTSAKLASTYINNLAELELKNIQAQTLECEVGLSK